MEKVERGRREKNGEGGRREMQNGEGRRREK
jgi:hypothetical protein